MLGHGFNGEMPWDCCRVGYPQPSLSGTFPVNGLYIQACVVRQPSTGRIHIMKGCQSGRLGQQVNLCVCYVICGLLCLFGLVLVLVLVWIFFFIIKT